MCNGGDVQTAFGFPCRGTWGAGGSGGPVVAGCAKRRGFRTALEEEADNVSVRTRHNWTSQR